MNHLKVDHCKIWDPILDYDINQFFALPYIYIHFHMPLKILHREKKEKEAIDASTLDSKFIHVSNAISRHNANEVRWVLVVLLHVGHNKKVSGPLL